MTDQPIKHRSEPVAPSPNDGVLETETKNGIKCVWNGRANYDGYHNRYLGLTLWWDFDWRELKETGVDGLSGHIIVTSPSEWFAPHKIKVNLTETTKKIETSIYYGSRDCRCSLIYEFTLQPRRSIAQEVKVKEVSYDEMFLPSPRNDSILLVDGRKLHVNKAFLSYHSDFFSGLFSSNFKEGQMDEIPIQDVSYEDFGLLMSIIYPRTVYPNDNNVEKLLELADRFMIPSIIEHVEYHLSHHSKINNGKMTWMADQYGMKELLEKCIREFNTIEKVKKLKASAEYSKLSKDTKTEILDNLFLFL